MTPIYNRNIIFTKTPLKHSFRYKDIFQIYPLKDPRSPQHSYCMDFPMIIEYLVDENYKVEVQYEPGSFKDWLQESGKQIISKNVIFYLLSSVTNHRFFDYPAGSGSWVMEWPEEITEDINKRRSEWRLNQYYFPESPAVREMESLVETDTPKIPLIPHNLYYYTDPVDGSNKIITFPSSINLILDNYFQLLPEDKRVVDSCISLINGGITIESTVPSLSIISFISSIETLVNYEFRNENKKIEFECPECQTLTRSPFKCQKCGNPIWGIGHKYREFLKTYIDERPHSLKKFKKYYNLRSKIIHEGLLLIGDNQLDWGKFESSREQYITRVEIKQLARLSLVNWLLMRNTK
ncbi:MAG TPA: hypothetical protein VFE66_07050 [Bacteroidales bacterium]|nr:hypothetical protein [Bacteroidales bacterium]